MYDERFARQYRYEPPPEFPQALPFTGIVHHLSGPNIYARAQTSPKWSVGFWCKLLSNHFHCARRSFHPRTRTYVRLLGPCFKTGRIKPFCHQVVQNLYSIHTTVRELAGEFNRVRSHTREHTTSYLELSSQTNPWWRIRQETLLIVRSEPAIPLSLASHVLTEMRNNHTKQHWFHPLSFQQFQALLTLFSKSFSSFPHGTCLLSVSNSYLAWDEIYHPICAPIPRNVTLRI